MEPLFHFYRQGGSIYFIVMLSARSPEAVLERYNRVWAAAMDATLATGGSISHHHGIGAVRLPWLTAELGASHHALAAIKRALDPDGILTPGALGLPAPTGTVE